MKRKKFHFRVYILLLTLCLLFAVYTVEQFKIKRIYIISQNLDIRGLSNLNNQNLLFVVCDKIKNKLTLLNPLVKSIKVQKNYPLSITIDVLAREPIARISNKTVTNSIDEDGVVIRGTDDNLPLVEIEQN